LKKNLGKSYEELTKILGNIYGTLGKNIGKS